MKTTNNTRMPLKSVAALLLVLAVFFVINAADAASGTWANTTSGVLWNDPANWSGGTVPLATIR